ncbi:MAG: methyltransferase family protein [Gemmatimonadales bacterium]|nr:methyltransferase family protein [Gemmatimonadales bacterium]
MRWQHKARIMRACSRVPFGDYLYKELQKRFGRLGADPMLRLPTALTLSHWAAEAGRPIEGCTALEVGTGHKPIVPIGLFLLGARRVYTFDLNRRLDLPLVTGALRWIAKHRDDVQELFAGATDRTALATRLDLLSRYASAPLKFFDAAQIIYRAPADAAHTELQDASVDLHISVTVLEHIPPPGIEAILLEARRVLAPDGIAVHFFDPSDHFAHQDSTIHLINFLRFSEEEWRRLANNQFAYCNRLRRSQYHPIYARTGFRVAREEGDVDAVSLGALRAGFRLDDQFREFAPEDICTTAVRVLLQ